MVSWVRRVTRVSCVTRVTPLVTGVTFYASK